jgi:uncharacterized protein YraI
MSIKSNTLAFLALFLAVAVMAFALTGCGSGETATPAPTAVPMADLPTVEPAPVAAGAPTATTITDTYIRTGPGTGYPAYAIAPAGKSAEILGKNSDGTWYAVALPTQYVAVGYGWVYSANVTVSNVPADLPVYPATPPPANIPVEPITSGEPQATAIDSVYVRSGPGEIYPAYGIAPAGTTGRVIGIDFASAMLRRAQRYVMNSGLGSRVRLQCGDACHIPLAAGSIALTHTALPSGKQEGSVNNTGVITMPALP